MLIPFTLFIALILFLLLLDLGVLNRDPHAISTREALAWTAFWVALSLVFAAAVYYFYEYNVLGIGVDVGYDLGGREASLLFLTAYVTEKSLSLDNIFVIALIFTYFGVPSQFQHRILFWGVLGALVMRGAMIAAGVALIHRFEWITYVFGAILILTAVKLLIDRHDNLEPDKNLVVRLVRKFVPVSDDVTTGRFFTVIGGVRTATPLFIVLVMVETTDLLFAVDSIPAVFAITSDPFLVFTSNVFAILGLRSLYFALAHVMDKFRYLKMSLVFLLAYVGVKMLLVHHYKIPPEISLSVIGGILGVGVLASILGGSRDTAPLASPLDELERAATLTWQQARRIVAIGFGIAVLSVGLAMLVLPGPGMLTVVVGLAILSSHFVWARRFLSHVRSGAQEVQRYFLGAKDDRGRGEP